MSTARIRAIASDIRPLLLERGVDLPLFFLEEYIADKAEEVANNLGIDRTYALRAYFHRGDTALIAGVEKTYQEIQERAPELLDQIRQRYR